MPETTSQHSCPIFVRNQYGTERKDCPVHTGVPVPRGVLGDISALSLNDRDGRRVPIQVDILERWPDKSAKWLGVDFIANIEKDSTEQYFLYFGNKEQEKRVKSPELMRTTAQKNSIVVNTGAAEFIVTDDVVPLEVEKILKGQKSISQSLYVVCEGENGKLFTFKSEEIFVEVEGDLRTSIINRGIIVDPKNILICNCTLRFVFYAGKSFTEIEAIVHNPRPAQHPGGLWDLGDRGSVFFHEFALKMVASDYATDCQFRLGYSEEIVTVQSENLVIHQNSSGGENWDSPNHVGSSGKATVSFKGYTVTADHVGEDEKQVAQGLRATPWLKLSANNSAVTVAIKDFWQNFPCSLRARENALEVSPFPKEQGVAYELQGGEQKRHVIFLEINESEENMEIENFLFPLHVWVDPVFVRKSDVVPFLSLNSARSNTVYEKYIASLVEGATAHTLKKEIIDEYGWRNYGDLYADHEAVNNRDDMPFISHYNNQYDCILGAAVQFLRCGEQRWYELFEKMARHVIDIDIYRTAGDKHSYNNGMFWHTDHYKRAATATHRSYSKAALEDGEKKGAYGGGPSNEHNYASGLLLYYYLTGDREAARAVQGLADWVLDLDDGRKNLFGLIDEGPAGLASQTVDVSYHHPGRGAGNSINTLIDAYRLTRDRRYLTKAEEIIRRCIHPEDNIGELDLDEPEYRWSYLAFLQMLGKYLDYKFELGELDYYFHYGRESLLHYAEWMAENEKPYKEVLHKVDIPTETWPAQDIRKCHVFFLAARFGGKGSWQRYREKAFFYFARCLEDLLSFNTAYLTRPQVLLLVFGNTCQYFFDLEEPLNLPDHNYDFGKPAEFVPQRFRLKKTLKYKLNVARHFVAHRYFGG